MDKKSIERRCLAAVRRKTRTRLEHVHGPLPDLRIGDIVLVRMKRGGLMRRLLRSVTRSHWDHSGLVVFPHDIPRGHKHDIIVEALQTGLATSLRQGVALHMLRRYLDDPERYDVGICRIAWLDETTREKLRSYALMNVDSPYYPISLTKVFLAWLSPWVLRRFNYRQRFSCSGLVQKALFEAVPENRRSRILFKSGYTPMQILDTVSPGDIARSSAITWVWNRHI